MHRETKHFNATPHCAACFYSSGQSSDIFKTKVKKNTDLCFLNFRKEERRVFGPKRDEVTGEWRKLHNEELNDPYSLSNIVRVVKSRRMRWAGHVACMGEDRGVHRVLVGKPEGKRPLGRPRCR